MPILPHTISPDERVMAQDQRWSRGRMQGQSQPGMTICVSFDQSAYRAQLVERAGQSERPHFTDRAIKLIDASPAHFTPQNVAKRGTGETEANPSLRLDFDNRDRGKMRADGAWIQVFPARQAEALTTGIPMLQEFGLRRREAGEIC